MKGARTCRFFRAIDLLKAELDFSNKEGENDRIAKAISTLEVGEVDDEIISLMDELAGNYLRVWQPSENGMAQGQKIVNQVFGSKGQEFSVLTKTLKSHVRVFDKG